MLARSGTATSRRRATFRQVKSASGNTTTATATFTNAPLDGNLLVASLRVGRVYADLTLPALFTDRVHDDDDGGTFTIDIAYKVIGPSHTQTIAYTWGVAAQWELGIYEIDRPHASPPDAVNSFDPAGATHHTIQPGTTGTLAQAREAVVSVAGMGNTNGGSETVDSNLAKFSGMSRSIHAYGVTRVDTALNPAFVWATDRAACAAIATFKLA
jgi:hypothetical protein